MPAEVNAGNAENTNGDLLVVDGGAESRDILRQGLQGQGYAVQECADGREALRLAREHRFDAILLDIGATGSDTLNLVTELKGDPDLRDTPVLVISASEDGAGIADYIQRGADDYLVRPFDPMFLQARLSAALDRKHLRDLQRVKDAELEHLRFELRRSTEDLQRFAYAASHDLQAPVRTITSYIQLLQRRVKAKLNDDEREMFGFAEAAAKRMNVLIRDLLQYAQVTTAETRLEQVDTNELLDALIVDMEGTINEAGARVTRDILPSVVSDPARLRQLFQNLIGNAIKYSGQDPPRVFISASAGAGHWRFSVKDNGQGIAPEHTSRIFEMFQRLHGDEIPGSGIGLAVCKRIVERSGGVMSVESVPGKGSTFSFTLPFPGQSTLT